MRVLTCARVACTPARSCLYYYCMLHTLTTVSLLRVQGPPALTTQAHTTPRQHNNTTRQKQVSSGGGTVGHQRSGGRGRGRGRRWYVYVGLRVCVSSSGSSSSRYAAGAEAKIEKRRPWPLKDQPLLLQRVLLLRLVLRLVLLLLLMCVCKRAGSRLTWSGDLKNTMMAGP